MRGEGRLRGEGRAPSGVGLTRRRIADCRTGQGPAPCWRGDVNEREQRCSRARLELISARVRAEVGTVYGGLWAIPE